MRPTTLAVLAAVLLLLPVAASAQQPGAPGRFDYYLLSLSWSPEFCATAGDRGAPEQCAGPRRYGFVLHGLWPQYDRGGYPAECPTAAAANLPETLVTRMLPIMPAPALVRHEWRNHGTCSGLPPDAYFDAASRAYRSIRIPEPYRQPSNDLTVDLAGLKSAFQTANPGLPPEAMAMTCKARYLQELRLCLTRDLQPRPCGRDVRTQCPDDALVLRRVR